MSIHSRVRFEHSKTLHAAPANDTLGVNVSFASMQEGFVTLTPLARRLLAGMSYGTCIRNLGLGPRRSNVIRKSFTRSWFVARCGMMLQMHHWIALVAVHLLSCVVRDRDRDWHLFVEVHVVQLVATTEVLWNIKTRLDHPTAHDVAEHAELDLHTMPNGN